VALNLIFDQSPILIANTAGIHQLRVPRVDRGVLAQVIGKLGLNDRRSGLTWERAQNWVIAEDEQITVAMNELSGGLRYRLRPLADEPGQDVATTAARLEEIARDFLGSFGRPSEPATLSRITYLRSQTTTQDGTPLTAATLDAGLVFTRTVDELPVIGQGGMVMVKIGTDELVVGGREIWRAIDKRGPGLKLRTPDEAIEILRSRLVAAGMDGDVHVRKAAQGYTELGIEEQQVLLAPCYAFLVETQGGLVNWKKVEVVPAPVSGPTILA
jgi:hypothetical protein